MLAFLRDHNDFQSVIDIFKRLYFELRPDRFCTLFKVCLANNGTEFSSPKAVKYDRQGNLRTRIFYCDPSASYSQEDICLMDGSYHLLQLESIGINALMMCFLFCMGRRSRIFLGATKLLPRT